MAQNEETLVAQQNIVIGEPITVTGATRDAVKQQLDDLRAQAMHDGLLAHGGFIEYHQGGIGEPDVFKATISFTQKTKSQWL